MALRLARGPDRDLGVDTVAAHQEVGDILDPGTLSRMLRTRDRMVGMRSASLGAQRIHTVRGGGSSSAFSSTLEVRSTIRSASSMIITR